jgi:carbon storage regulator
MLILSRRIGEKVMVGEEIEVAVLGVARGYVRLGISAPRSVAVHREEVYARIKRKESLKGSPADRSRPAETIARPSGVA